MIPVGVIILSLASPLDEERLRYVKDTLNLLKNRLNRAVGVIDVKLATSISDVREVAESHKGDVEAVGIVVLSGGTDRMIYDAVKMFNKPSLVYAQPLHNSLASVREAVAALKLEGYDLKVEYGGLEEAPNRLRDFALAASAWRRLRGSRVGLVGRPEPWLLLRRDPDMVWQRFGVEIVDVPWDELYDGARAFSDDEVNNVVKDLYSTFGGIDVGREDLDKAVRLYLSMKAIAEKYKLNAMAVEARDMLRVELRDWGPYLGVALISDDGITADYEVDVDAILTKYVIYLLTGKQSFMANITRIDRENNTAVFSHCTIPPSMIDKRSSRLTTYFETNKTVAIKGKLREGVKVTFARIGGPKLNKIMIGTGEIINGYLDDPTLCRTQALVRVDGDPLKLIEKSLGNHTILTYGDITRKLIYFSWIAGMEPINISQFR